MEELRRWKKVILLSMVILAGLAWFFWNQSSESVLVGGSMTKEEFANLYGRAEKPTVEEVQAVLQEEELVISGVEVQGRNAQLTLSVASRGADVTIPGSLMASYKVAEGVNCTYIEPERSDGMGERILRIEIWNDTAPDEDLFVNPQISGTPHMKIYMEYKNRIFLFEDVLPEEFAEVQTDICPIPSFSREEVWAWGMTPLVEEALPMTEDFLENMDGYQTSKETNRRCYWTPEEIYTKTAYINGKLAGFYSCPVVTYWYSDLAIGKEMNWKMGFEVQEYFAYDGQREYGNNDITYKNIRLILDPGRNAEAVLGYLTGSVEHKEKDAVSVEQTNEEGRVTTQLYGDTKSYVLSKSTYIDEQLEGHWLQAEGKVRCLDTGNQAKLKITYTKSDRNTKKEAKVAVEMQLPYRVWEEGLWKHAEDAVGSPGDRI